MSNERDNNVIVLPRRRTRSPIAALRRLPLPRRRQPCEATSSSEPTISDYDLHAFVDDALDSARRQRVQIFLVRHPDVATEAAAYRRQNRLLRELRRERTAVSPAMGYLTVQLAHRLSFARARRALMWSAVAAMVMGAIAAALNGIGLLAVPHVILTAGR